MKARIKELYTDAEDIKELSMDAFVASLILTDDFGELLYEFFISRSQYGGIKYREEEYQKRRDCATRCKTVWDILSLYGVTDYK